MDTEEHRNEWDIPGASWPVFSALLCCVSLQDVHPPESVALLASVQRRKLVSKVVVIVTLALPSGPLCSSFLTSEHLT